MLPQIREQVLMVRKSIVCRPSHQLCPIVADVSRLPPRHIAVSFVRLVRRLKCQVCVANDRLTHILNAMVHVLVVVLGHRPVAIHAVREVGFHYRLPILQHKVLDGAGDVQMKDRAY
jgi:hypothetical protein